MSIWIKFKIELLIFCYLVRKVLYILDISALPVLWFANISPVSWTTFSHSWWFLFRVQMFLIFTMSSWSTLFLLLLILMFYLRNHSQIQGHKYLYYLLCNSVGVTFYIICIPFYIGEIIISFSAHIFGASTLPLIKIVFAKGTSPLTNYSTILRLILAVFCRCSTCTIIHSWWPLFVSTLSPSAKCLGHSIFFAF